MVADQPRGVAARALRTGLLLFLIAMAIVLGTRRLLARDPRFRESDNLRQIQMLAALPGVVADPRPLVLVMGGSTLYRLDTDRLDADLHARGVEVTSYNISLAGLTPTQLRLLAERVRDVAGGRRFRAILVEGGLLNLTAQYRAYMSEQETSGLYYVALLDHGQVRELTHTRFEVGMSALWRQILDVETAGDAPDWLRDRVFMPATPPCRFSTMTMPASLRGPAERLCVAQRELFPHGTPPWELSTRGFPKKDYPTTHDALEAVYAVDRAAQIHHHAEVLGRRIGAVDLQMSDASIEETRAAFQILAGLTDHLVVVTTPAHSALVALRSPEARARGQHALEQVAAGYTFVDLQSDTRFVDSDFQDPVHFIYGKSTTDRFAAAVAERLAPVLGR